MTRYLPVTNPPQWLLDGLLKEDRLETCPDCGVNIGEQHIDGCDWAVCLSTMQQRLSCDCGNCGEEVFDGVSIYAKVAYKYKLVVFDCGSIYFDLNKAAELAQKLASKHKKEGSTFTI